jgi:hypothetical protein
MTKDEIIQMAIDAGLNLYVNDLTEKQYIEVIEHFAKLVAQHEREACAKLCAEFGIQGWDCEEAIRARGQA